MSVNRRRLLFCAGSALLAILVGSRAEAVTPQHRVLLGGHRYLGPGDIVPGATVFLGLLPYNAAYAASGGNAAILRNTSTEETCTFGFVPSGAIGAAKSCSGSSTGDQLSTFCAESSGSCAVQQLYDHTGNGNNSTQSTTSKQPAIIVSCQNNLPCLVGNGTSDVLIGNSGVSAQPVTYSFVGSYAGSVSFAYMFSAGGGGGIAFQRSGSSTTTVILNGGAGVTAPAAIATTYGFTAVANDPGNSVVYVDGVAGTAGNAGSDSPNSTAAIFASTTGIDFNAGEFMEGGIWPFALTAYQALALCHSQRLRWSTGGIC